MKKIALLLPLLLLACQKKEAALPQATQTPATTQTGQTTDALDSATIAKLAAINPAEPWNNAKAYKAGEVIIFSNETWIAIRPGYQNTPPPDEWFWKKIILTGTPAPQPTAQVVNVASTAQPATAQTATAQTQPAQAEQPAAVSAAPYDMNREYKAGEVVSFNKKTYVAKRAVFLNTNPSDSWFWEEKK